MYHDAVAILRTALALDEAGWARLSAPLPAGYKEAGDAWSLSVMRRPGSPFAMFLDGRAAELGVVAAPELEAAYKVVERVGAEVKAVGAGIMVVLASRAGLLDGADATRLLAGLDDDPMFDDLDPLLPFAGNYDLLLSMKDPSHPLGAASGRLGALTMAAVLDTPVPFSETAEIASALRG